MKAYYFLLVEWLWLSSTVLYRNIRSFMNNTWNKNNILLQCDIKKCFLYIFRLIVRNLFLYPDVTFKIYGFHSVVLHLFPSIIGRESFSFSDFIVDTFRKCEVALAFQGWNKYQLTDAKSRLHLLRRSIKSSCFYMYIGCYIVS